MPKFTFKCEHENFRTGEINDINISEFHAESLNEVIENFERFLKGSGYFFSGQLDFVDDDSSSSLSSDELVAGSLEDFDSLTPSSAVFSFDTMISGSDLQESKYSINTDKESDNGVIFPRGNDEDIIHFRV